MSTNLEELIETSLCRLDYYELLEHLSSYAVSEPAKALALNLRPLKDINEIRERLEELKELSRLMEAGVILPLEFFRDLTGKVEKAKKAGMLTCVELVEIKNFIELCIRVKKTFSARSNLTPLLFHKTRKIENLKELFEDLDRSFDERGELSSKASPALEELRSEYQVLRSSVYREIERLLRDKELENYLQDQYFTEREGRLVLPVKKEAQSKVSGIVHDSSASKATVFIEPSELVESNNRLRILEREIQEEEERIRRKLTSRVGEEGEKLILNQRIISELDLLQAKVKLKDRLKAEIPLITEEPFLKLYQVRHPLMLLSQRQAIANDLFLGTKENVLLISGPNSGGKTVFLKTIGLVCLMIRAGLAIPAKPDSRLGIFENIFAQIGDEQDLSKDLSSYSADLKELIGYLEKATPKTMVLLDELFSSTDPSEASALAEAYLKSLSKKAGLIIVTTHLSKLKEFAQTEDGVVNASFEFDPAEFKPTYRLRIGIPGQSYGIATAQRLGMHEAIILEAKQRLEPGSRLLIELLEKLEMQRINLEKELKKVEEIKENLDLMNRDLEKKLNEINEKEQKFNIELKARIKSELKKAKLEIDKIITKAAQTTKPKELVALKKELVKMDREIESRFPEPEPGEPVAPEELKKGDIVWLKPFGKKGELFEINLQEKRGIVLIGDLKVYTSLFELRRISSASEEAVSSQKSTQKEKGAKEGGLTLENAPLLVPISTANTLDLRGKRADEAEVELIQYLDLQARNGVPNVYIIHGHGAGILKNMVRERLRSSPYVQSFRAGERDEGGDGVTVAFLEKMGR